MLCYVQITPMPRQTAPTIYTVSFRFADDAMISKLRCVYSKSLQGECSSIKSTTSDDAPRLDIKTVGFALQ